MIRRRPPHRFLLEGPILALEAVLAEIELDLVMISPPQVDPKLSSQLQSRARVFVEASPDIIEYAADTQQPQGILAIATVPARLADPPPEPCHESRVIVLDGVQDPGNVGTIVRTVRAAGFAGVVLAGPSVDPWSPKAVRASAGAMFWVPVWRFAERSHAVEFLQAGGWRLMCAEASAAHTCYEADFSSPLALVLGSEAHGVGEELRASCVDGVRIPMTAGVESLNLAAAAAILMYMCRAQDGFAR